MGVQPRLRVPSYWVWVISIGGGAELKVRVVGNWVWEIYVGTRQLVGREPEARG